MGLRWSPSAHRTLHERPIDPDATPSEPVDVRCVDQSMPRARDRVPPQLITHDEQHVVYVLVSARITLLWIVGHGAQRRRGERSPERIESAEVVQTPRIVDEYPVTHRLIRGELGH